MVLMISLQYTHSATASLLLNFEPVATTIPAVFFHESVDKKIAIALGIGFFSYGGITSVLFLLALRGIGTARTGAILAVSPFFGVLIALVVFPDPLPPAFFIALPVMGIGAYLLMTENHSHIHTHPAVFHEHRHDHDDLHHDHHHMGFEPPISSFGEHCHPHEHEELIHVHLHKPDIHHRHSYE